MVVMGPLPTVFNMTSIVAPKIDADLPTTLAHEWANETSTQLEETKTAAAENRPSLASSLSTPGVEVPGGYPRGTETEATEGTGNGGILDMAKQYLPAQQDVQQVLLNATETAKQYLPPSVAAYFPGGKETSLPSQEGPQKPLEHSDGIGSLPGNASESSVAKLPDERANVQGSKATTLPTQEGPQKPFERSDGIGSMPGNASESSVAKLPDERANVQGGKATTLPTQQGPRKPFDVLGGIGSFPGNASELPHEKMGIQGTPNAAKPSATALTPATNGQLSLDDISKASVQAQLGETPAMTPAVDGVQTPKIIDGVRDLPGGKSESTVAMVPDERKESNAQAGYASNGPREPVLNLAPRTHPLAAEGAQWKGVPLHEDFQKKLDVHENHDRPDANNPNGLADFVARQDKTESDVAVSGHEPLSTPTPSALSPSGNGSRFLETSDGTRKNREDVVSTTSGGSGGSDGSRSVGGTPRKPKLMDKLKGEVKVITGKLGGKEDKVEEGRRLMGKV
ncbi:hypothetical protein L218DRAFT_935171 [Marasmius fiardii PR-910]|nr:hypothetical protein L218DRAFT_935171 [Marasmius fiardii PR-910]